MQAALERVRRRLRRRRSRCSSATTRIADREMAEVRYPADPSLLLGRVAQATADDVDDAVRLAQRGLPGLARPSGASDRGDILRRAADLMEARRFELAALMVYESAKPWHEADGDVIEACDYLRFYAREAERLLQPVAMDAGPAARTTSTCAKAAASSPSSRPGTFPSRSSAA